MSTMHVVVAAVISERGLRRLAEGKAHCVHAYAKVVDEDDVPLVREADAQAAIKAARAQALEEAAKAIEPSNMDYPDDWTEYARIEAGCAVAIRRLVDHPARESAP